jgi:hypothetical protein
MFLDRYFSSFSILILHKMYNLSNMNTIPLERHQQLVNRVDVEEKRKSLKTPWGSPVMISYEHIERHFEGSGLLGASIIAWDNPESMLLDKEVWQFIENSVKKLNKNLKPGEARNFSHQFNLPIGKESICKIEDLPKEAKIWLENRERYVVNVTDVAAPKTDSLNIMLVRDLKNPSRILLHSAWAGSIESPSGGLSNPDWENYAFYAENN